MNQILVTKKLYVTPELKRKKKIYKINFFLSIFLVIILVSLYIYAEYDKNKNEELSQELLANAEAQEDTTIYPKDILVAVLNDTTGEATQKANEQQLAQINVEASKAVKQNKVYTTNDGFQYTIDAKIYIPAIGIEYPILLGKTGSEAETDALLKISPTKFHGYDANGVGNYCIVGHNYRNTKFFSKVPTLKNGDIIELTNLTTKSKINYVVYDKYIVDPNDRDCTSQLTNGKKEITLITCTDDSKQRYIIKATEIK